MNERTFVFEDFSDKVEQVFVLADPDVPAIPLTLAQAEPLSSKFSMPGSRPPFSLTFVARDPRVLPQRIYRVEHNGLGALDLFLVPLAKDADGVSYCATFN